MLEGKLANALTANQVAAAEESEQQNEVVAQPEVKLTSLFANESKELTQNNHQLSKTAMLTNISSKLASEIFAKVAADPAEYEAQILASQKSHDAMDDLIATAADLGAVDVEFLKSESKESLEKMIRSQQSKRSRAKSKVMTQENYMTMMTGAVAEILLRLAADMPKSSGGGTVMGEIGFSDEDLDNLAEFPDELKKAIRNVQSKKSIMKAKSGFDPESTRWKQLLIAEQQLKEVRDRVNGLVNEEATEALEVKKAAEEMLADVNPAELSQQDALDLLAKMKGMLAGN